MMELKPTTEQNRAIKSRKGQVIVTASAGAGKTLTMVNRVLDLLLDAKKPLSAGEIIMLTFTEAAAADMKKKLEKALFKRLDAAEKAGDREEKKALIRLLDDLPLLRSSTIDSFCFSLVKSHFETLELPPTVSMVDEETAKSYREKAMKVVLDAFATRAHSGSDADVEAYFRFLEPFSGNEDEALSEAISDLYDYAETTRDGDEFFQMAEKNATCPIDENPIIAKLVKDKKDAARQARADIASKGFTIPLGAKNMQAVRANIEKVFDLLDQATTLKDVVAVAAATDFSAALGSERKTLKNECAVWDAIYNIYKKWKDTFFDLKYGNKANDCFFKKDYDALESEIEAARKECLTMIELAREFKKEYQKIKREEDVLDFADIEHYALRLLGTPDIVEDVGCRQLMVDESQDLNRLQEELMCALRGKGDLYIVGDVKQSIYRFRQADPELFNKRVQAGESDPNAEVIGFDQNFRSSDAVVGYVNKVFSRLMTPEFGGIGYRDADRGDNHNGDGEVSGYIYKRKKINAPQVGSESYSVAKGAKSAAALRSQSGEDREADWVCENILRLMREKPFIHDTEATDPEDEAHRGGNVFKLEYKHFKIISPIRMKPGSVEEKVVDRLRAAGIPVNVDGFVKDASNDDVSAMMDFLRLLVSSRDDYALLSVLRSEIFSFSLDALARIAMREGGSFSEKAESMREEDAAIGAVYHCLDRYRGLASTLSLYELLSLLVEERLRRKILLRPDGRKSLGETLSFIDSLKSCKEAESIPEFLEFFEKYYKKEFEGEIAEENAVNFMTIHKSKGLEAPVVFVIGLSKQVINSMEDKSVVRMDADYGVAKKTALGKDLLFEIYRKKKHKELKEDCLRMLYVALTRAKNYLFVSGGFSSQAADDRVPLKEDAKYCSQLILAGMGEYPVVEDFVQFTYPVPKKEGENSLAKEDASKEDNAKEPDLSDLCDVAPEDASELYESESSLEAPIEEDEIAADVALAAERALPDPPTETEIAFAKEARERFASAMRYRYPHETATRTGIKYTVTGINEMTKEKVAPATRFFPDEAAAKGTAYHTVLEYVSFDLSSVKEAADTLRELASRGIITEEEAADISPKRLYEGVRIIKETIGERRDFREKSFLLHLPANAAGVADTLDEIEVQGKMDLLALGEDDAVIVDYKLSSHTKEELISTYRKQLSLYEAAVKSTYGREKVRKYIFVPGRNEIFEVTEKD